MSEHNNESILSLRDLLKVLFKRQRVIVILTLVSLISSAIVVFLTPPTYESTAQVLVRRSVQEEEEPSLGTERRVPTNTFRQVNQSDDMNTAISIVRSRDLVVAVIDKLSLTREQFDKVPDFRRYVRMSYRWILDMASTAWCETKYLLRLSSRPTAEEIKILQRERFIGNVVKAVVVDQVTDSDVLRVGLRISDPILAHSFAKLLSEMALNWHYEKSRQEGNVIFFNEQAETAAAELDTLQKALAETRHDLNLIGIEEKRKLIIENTFHLQMRLNEILARKSAVIASISTINDMLSSETQMVTISTTKESNPLREQISEKMTALELQRAETAIKHQEKGRVIRDIDTTLSEWQKQLKHEPEKHESSVVEGLNTIQQSLRLKLVDLKTENAALTAEEMVVSKNIENYTTNLEAINNGAYRIEDLERLVRTQATVYEQYLKSSELSRASEAKQSAHMANLNIIETASLPIKPIKPKKWLTIMLAGGCGLLLGLAWAFATEMNDNTFSNGVELSRTLALEALSTFPLVDATVLEDIATSAPTALRAEANVLWNRIDRFSPSETPIVAFLSSRTGEGSTTVMLQTALTVAESRQVLVIDNDPSLSITKRYGLLRQFGLSDYGHSAGLDKIIHQTESPRLGLIPAGTKDDLGTFDWPAFFAVLRGRGQPVFLDLGARGTSSLPPDLLASMSGLILVVAAHETRREVIEQTLAELKELKNAQILGAVLNKRRFFIPGFLYRNA